MKDTTTRQLLSSPLECDLVNEAMNTEWSDTKGKGGARGFESRNSACSSLAPVRPDRARTARSIIAQSLRCGNFCDIPMVRCLSVPHMNIRAIALCSVARRRLGRGWGRVDECGCAELCSVVPGWPACSAWRIAVLPASCSSERGTAEHAASFALCTWCMVQCAWENAEPYGGLALEWRNHQKPRTCVP